MKKILYLVLLMNSIYAYSQHKINDEYNFPVKQGSKEWEQFESVEKRLAALQIPDLVLAKISTEGLLETCPSRIPPNLTLPAILTALPTFFPFFP